MFANILKSIVVCIVCISNLALDIELHKQVQMWAHLEKFFFSFGPCGFKIHVIENINHLANWPNPFTDDIPYS